MTPRISPTPKPTPRLYASPEFVLCAGCVLFHFPRPQAPQQNGVNGHTRPAVNGAGEDDDWQPLPEHAETMQVCILHHNTKDEWMLPKGRKDQGESIEEAASRETYEETSYKCRLLGVDLYTRSLPAGVNMKDKPSGWLAPRTKEPFMVTQRTLGPHDQKFTFWFVARVETPAGGGEPVKDEGTQTDSENFTSCFLPADKAVARLSFEGDREVVRQAIRLVRQTYFPAASDAPCAPPTCAEAQQQLRL
ncbi:hypothetical protein AURDEDRAFT_114540 [Auricularia subglabra TFB-10046 SS5]|nr:hypothetical protein AURDEDRAFT_114540 [Auricularia subglabra TFB-10046 SS5]